MYLLIGYIIITSYILGFPLRALYLMTKRNFRSPSLQHKNKWSENFHDFLKSALQKDPRKRPSAAELLKVSFLYTVLNILVQLFQVCSMYVCMSIPMPKSVYM